MNATAWRWNDGVKNNLNCLLLDICTLFVYIEFCFCRQITDWMDGKKKIVFDWCEYIFALLWVFTNFYDLVELKEVE